MNKDRKRELKNKILSHIACSIEGELQGFNELEEWLNFEFKNEEERDVCADIMQEEADRFKKRIC
uniref:Uncharacterized protein n=1 Tax=viral metagenome TaxID=1070528 RepID=A0A6M3XUF5_9ZZZZ